MILVMAYSQFFLAPKLQPAQPNVPQASTQVGQGAAPASNAPQAGGGGQVTQQPRTSQVVDSAQGHVGHPTKEEILNAESTVVESPLTKVVISHLGARVQSLHLKQYKRTLGAEESLDLIDNPAGTALPLGVYGGNFSDDFVVYQLTSVDGAPASSAAVSPKLQPGARTTLEFSGVLPGGATIKKTYTFDDSYLFHLNVALSTPLPGGVPVWIEWSHLFPDSQTKSRATPMHVTYLDGSDKVKYVQNTEIPQGMGDFGTSKWAALGDNYFMAALIPTIAGRNTMFGKENEFLISRVAGTPTGGEFSVYAGPKDYHVLQGIGGYHLERAIDLGWFAFLAYPLLWLLHALFEITKNYGLAIIALTLLVKTALLPLSKAGYESMRKMQDIAPEIKAIRDRVKDPTQQNQEIFALYQRRGVNPMGGCFPMVIQIPVFLGLYQALLNSIDLRHAPFALWIHDLAAPEKLEIFGIGVPVMVLLMSASMILQQWMTPNPSADPAQQKAMMIMPVVFAGMFIIFPMPAGLVLYWLVNNAISISQQMYMRNTEKGSVYVGTAVASLGIFGIGFLLTLM